MPSVVRNRRSFLRTGVSILAIAIGTLFAAGVALSQEHEHADHGRAEARPGPARVPAAHVDGRGQVLDSRYNHGRYYPPVGAGIRSLPPDYRPYFHGSDRFYFSGGIWYAPSGPGFVVVRPPVGVVISVLPPFYSTVWIGGLPYYYADNVYYSWAPDQSGYAVVDPPTDADQPSPPPDRGPAEDLIIYPKTGQTPDSQAADRYECHRWAAQQSGFDPTVAGSGGDRGNYNRAMSACLQARGYEVK